MYCFISDKSCMSIRVNEMGRRCGYKWKEAWVFVPRTAWCLAKRVMFESFVLELPMDNWNYILNGIFYVWSLYKRILTNHGFHFFGTDNSHIVAEYAPRGSSEGTILTEKYHTLKKAYLRKKYKKTYRIRKMINPTATPTSTTRARIPATIINV